MTTQEPDILTVRVLTRDVVSALAPAEIPVLDTYLAAYEADPRAIRTWLGLTPYVVGSASSALTFVAAQSGPADRVRRLVGRVFSRTPGVSPTVTAAQLLALTPTHLQRVREVAYGKAKEMHLAEPTAINLADTMVGCLALRGE